MKPRDRDAVRRRRATMMQQIADAQCVLIAGGHVAVLLNRLRMFDLAPGLREKPVVAWSAGAMVATERVVLFHDHPPQGAGNAEILDRGLALCRGLVALPHAEKRLALDDPVRVSLLARRFSDFQLAALDPGARLDWEPLWMTYE